MKNTPKHQLAEMEMLGEDFVERASALCEQRGGIPESEFDAWLEDDEILQWKKSA